MGIVEVCNGQCHCCMDTSECFNLKGGDGDAVKEREQSEGDNPEGSPIRKGGKSGC